MTASFEHVQELDPKEVDFLNHSYGFKTIKDNENKSIIQINY